MTTITQDHYYQQKKSNNSVPGAIAGVGIGAAGGALGGYKLVKPWLENGKLSDSFVRSSMNNTFDLLSAKSEEKEIIKLAKEIFNLSGKTEIAEKDLFNLFKNNAKAFKIEKMDDEAISATVKKLIKKNGDAKNVIKSLKKFSKLENLNLGDMFSDIKKGTLKPVAENAPELNKQIVEMLENSIKNLKKNAALKWAGIGAVAVGLLGLGIGAISKKEQHY